MLENVIPLVISGLNNPDVSPSATMALKDVTQNCQKYLQPYGDLIVVACQVYDEQLVICSLFNGNCFLGHITKRSFKISGVCAPKI